MLAGHNGCLGELVHGILVKHAGPPHEELLVVVHFMHRHQVLRHLNILVRLTRPSKPSNLAEGTMSICVLPRLLEHLLPHLHHLKMRNRLTGQARAHLSWL